MALETSDLMMLKGLEKEGMTPYEQYMVGYKQSKKPSGVAIAGLVLGTVGVVAGATAWIFAPSYTNAKAGQAKEAAQSAKELANAQIIATQRQLDQLTNLFATERQERINGDITLNATINDTVSGTQSGQLTASQVATNEATAQVMAGLMTGQYSQNPIKVVRVSGQRECPCDSGCGCNG